MRTILTTYHTFLILGVFTAVAGKENLVLNDMNYGSLDPDLLKEKCLEYPDLLPCHYWNSLQEEEAEDNDENRLTNEIMIPKDSISESGNSRENKKEILIELPITNPERNLEKRFSVFRRRNPGMQGYKRGPGFRSWGGKRDTINASPNLEKRSKFTSWGGKRDYESFEDYSTAAKEDLLIEQSPNFSINNEDRNMYGKDDNLPSKRSKFRSWGGKIDTENPVSYDQLQKRAPTWIFKEQYQSEPFKKHVPKRPHFQSWGGKRTIQSWNGQLGFYLPSKSDLKNLWKGDKKRKFSSWGGKRNDNNLMTGMEKRKEQSFNSWEGKREPHHKIKQIFRNWGGKRTTTNLGYENEEQVEPSIDNVFTVKSISEELPPTIYDNAKSVRKKRGELQNDSQSLLFEPQFEFKSWGGKRMKEGTRR